MANKTVHASLIEEDVSKEIPVQIFDFTLIKMTMYRGS